MSEKPIYFGHMCVKDGVLKIDLGGRILENGVYSIMKEPNIKKIEILNKDTKKDFADEVRRIVADNPGIKRYACAVKMNCQPNTFNHRVKVLNLGDLFV